MAHTHGGGGFWLKFFYSPTAKLLSRGAVKKFEPEPPSSMCVHDVSKLSSVNALTNVRSLSFLARPLGGSKHVQKLKKPSAASISFNFSIDNERKHGLTLHCARTARKCIAYTTDYVNVFVVQADWLLSHHSIISARRNRHNVGRFFEGVLCTKNRPTLCRFLLLYILHLYVKSIRSLLIQRIPAGSSFWLL